MKNMAKHLPHYLPLLGIFAFGILAFILFSYDASFQLAVVVAIAVSYVIWGIIHHHLHRDLHPSVIVEYLIVAALGVVLISSLILR